MMVKIFLSMKMMRVKIEDILEDENNDNEDENNSSKSGSAALPLDFL